MKYGIMQGRLLPKYKGRYQAFPINTWEKEFKLASMLNLSSIEFILDYHEFDGDIFFRLKIIKKILEISRIFLGNPRIS